MDRTRPTHAIWLLLAATLLLRALVPAGWMPDVDRSDAIVAKMCNSAMTVTIPLGRERVPDDSAAQHSAPCLFAGFASDAMTGLLTYYTALLAVIFATALILTLKMAAESWLDEHLTMVFTGITAIILAGLSVHYAIGGMATIGFVTP